MFLAIAVSAALLLGGGGDKVEICHKGNPINIAAPAVPAHVANHGDTIGACSVEEPPAPVVPAPVLDPCEEDEPCWDCATMGNLICGSPPVVVVEVPAAHNTHAPPEAIAAPSLWCIGWTMFDPYCI